MPNGKIAVADPGSGPPPPPPPNQTWRLRLKFLHRQDRISVFNWLFCFFFLMGSAWHFSSKLNYRHIQKCNINCFWVPSCDLFAFVRKAVFPAPPASGVHRLRNTWSSLLSQLINNYGDNLADNHVLSTCQIQWNENEQSTVKKLKLKPCNLKTVSCLTLVSRFLRNVSDYGTRSSGKFEDIRIHFHLFDHKEKPRNTQTRTKTKSILWLTTLLKHLQGWGETGLEEECHGFKTDLDWLTRLALQSQCQESLGSWNIGTMHLV